MKQYKCHICKYETELLSNLERHKNSKKHIKKVNIYINSPGKESILPQIECEYCNAIVLKKHISRHLQRCVKKKLCDYRLIELEKQNEELRKRTDDLENQTKLKDDDLRTHQNYIMKKDEDIRRKDLVDWTKDPNHIYIGRDMTVYVPVQWGLNGKILSLPKNMDWMNVYSCMKNICCLTRI